MSKFDRYIEFLNNPNVERIFICGDIHGEYQLLIKSLNSLGFDFENDLLICTGDLVDRGEGNLEVIDLLNKPWFKSIRGNHDQMCIDGLSNNKMREIHKDNSGEWFYNLSDKKQQKIVKQLSKLPIILDVNYRGYHFGIIHGDIHVNDWEQFKSLFSQHNSSWIEHLKQNVIWGRTRITHPNKGFTQVANIDYVFLGHTIVKKPTQVNNCFYIDTGAFHTHNFTFAVFDKTGISIQTIKGKKP